VEALEAVESLTIAFIELQDGVVCLDGGFVLRELSFVNLRDANLYFPSQESVLDRRDAASVQLDHLRPTLENGRQRLDLLAQLCVVEVFFDGALESVEGAFVVSQLVAQQASDPRVELEALEGLLRILQANLEHTDQFLMVGLVHINGLEHASERRSQLCGLMPLFVGQPDKQRLRGRSCPGVGRLFDQHLMVRLDGTLEVLFLLFQHRSQFEAHIKDLRRAVQDRKLLAEQLHQVIPGLFLLVESLQRFERCGFRTVDQKDLSIRLD